MENMKKGGGGIQSATIIKKWHKFFFVCLSSVYTNIKGWSCHLGQHQNDKLTLNFNQVKISSIRFFFDTTFEKYFFFV